MPLSEEKLARSREAFTALHALLEEYADVLVVLDYVLLADVANYQADSEENPAGETLTEDELASVLWRLGKHVGSGENSQNLLGSLTQFALDENERRKSESDAQ